MRVRESKLYKDAKKKMLREKEEREKAALERIVVPFSQVLPVIEIPSTITISSTPPKKIEGEKNA